MPHPINISADKHSKDKISMLSASNRIVLIIIGVIRHHHQQEQNFSGKMSTLSDGLPPI